MSFVTTGFNEVRGICYQINKDVTDVVKCANDNFWKEYNKEPELQFVVKITITALGVIFGTVASPGIFATTALVALFGKVYVMEAKDEIMKIFNEQLSWETLRGLGTFVSLVGLYTIVNLVIPVEVLISAGIGLAIGSYFGPDVAAQQVRAPQPVQPKQNVNQQLAAASVNSSSASAFSSSSSSAFSSSSSASSSSSSVGSSKSRNNSDDWEDVTAETRKDSDIAKQIAGMTEAQVTQYFASLKSVKRESDEGKK